MIMTGGDGIGNGARFGKGPLALIPISLSNSKFSSARMRSAIKALPRGFGGYLFLVADSLEEYNVASRALAKKKTSGHLLGKLQADPLSQRKIWIERLLKRISHDDPTKPRWRVVSTASLVDTRFMYVFRRVLIVFLQNKHFSNDVTAAALKYTSRRQSWSGTIAVNLSELYILEELALSILLHIVDGIESEFYLFRQHDVIINVYRGLYGFSVFDLAGEQRRDLDWFFYEFSEVTTDHSRAEWIICHKSERFG